MTTVTITMPEALLKFAEGETAAGGFRKIDDYILSLLSAAQSRENDADPELERLLLQGLEDGKDIPITPEFWTNLRMECMQETELTKEDRELPKSA